MEGRELEPHVYLYFKTFKQSVHLRGMMCFLPRPSTPPCLHQQQPFWALLLLMHVESWGHMLSPWPPLKGSLYLSDPTQQFSEGQCSASSGKSRRWQGKEGVALFTRTLPWALKYIAFQREGLPSQESSFPFPAKLQTFQLHFDQWRDHGERITETGREGEGQGAISS